MKKILITGANSQFSQHFIRWLQLNQPDVQVLTTTRNEKYDKQSYLFDKSKVEFVLTPESNNTGFYVYLLKTFKPDYFINTMGATSIARSWLYPEEYVSVNTVTVLRQLEAIKTSLQSVKYINLGSSEELTGINPYSISKGTARSFVETYRKAYGLKCSQLYCFNFESELRQESAVSRKISLNISRINKEIINKQKIIPMRLGNLEIRRDWSYVGDFVEAVWLVLHSEKEMKDYTLASGETHSLMEFVELAFSKIGVSGFWEGKGLNKKFYIANYLIDIADINGIELVVTDSEFYRPTESEGRAGNIFEIYNDLGWKPKTSFKDLVYKLVEFDLCHE